MDLLISGLAVIAVFSLMYGVICIDTYFQNNRSAYTFLLKRKDFSLETIKAFDKELGE